MFDNIVIKKKFLKKIKYKYNYIFIYISTG